MTRRELPLLLKGPLVLATMERRKTQTRRPVTSRNGIVDGQSGGKRAWRGLDLDRARVDPGPSPAGNPGPYLKVPRNLSVSDGWPEGEETVHRVYPRWAVGDWLWVREPTECRGCLPIARRMEVRYLADGLTTVVDWPERIKRPRTGHRLANGAYKEASRVWVEITGVRPERVQDISSSDAYAEGFADVWDDLVSWEEPTETSQERFLAAWAAIYGAGNPWVWVIDYKLLSTTGRPT